MTARDDRLGRLFDFLVLNPQGVTVDDMQEHLECGLTPVVAAIKDLRRFLGDVDGVNLKCRRQGPNERWLYRLVDGADDDLDLDWDAGRTIDIEERIKTLLAVTSSMVRSTDGRTLKGKRQLKMQKHLTRLLEDLQEIEAAG